MSKFDTVPGHAVQALGFVSLLVTACSDPAHHVKGGGGANETDGGGKDAAPADSGGGAGAGEDAGTSHGSGVWPMMGYDEKNWYLNPNETTLSVKNAPKLVQKWTTKLPGVGFPPGTPVVAEGMAFVMGTTGTFALSLADGSIVWERRDVAGFATLAYVDGFLYAHRSPKVTPPEVAKPELFKIKAADGKTVWGPVVTFDFQSSNPTSSPIVSGDVVMVGRCTSLEIEGMDHPNEQATARGGVDAFYSKDGTRAWAYDTVDGVAENGAMVWSSVGVDVAAGVVYAASGNNYTLGGKGSDAIHAIDISSGTKLWSTQVQADDIWSFPVAPGGPDTDFGANPIVVDLGDAKIVAAGDKGSTFWALNRETGEILWKHAKLSNSRNAQNGGVLMNGAFDGTYFYVVSNQPMGGAGKLAVLHALDPAKKGADVWSPVMLAKMTWSAPSLANGVLVVPDDDDLLIMDASTGKELKRFSVGGTMAGGAAAIVDGNVIVQSGLQYMFAPNAKNNNSVSCYGLP